MDIKKYFNVRVYGLLIEQEQILLSYEQYKGFDMLKFPGGGLEYGESTVDGLKREFKEELNCDIEVLNHFYTTDFFQPSFFDGSQVLSIYYFVKRQNPTLELMNLNPHEQFQWHSLLTLTTDMMTYPIEKKVVSLLLPYLKLH